jgi:hypothetical protein
LRNLRANAHYIAAKKERKERKKGRKIEKKTEKKKEIHKTLENSVIIATSPPSRERRQPVFIARAPVMLSAKPS